MHQLIHFGDYFGTLVFAVTGGLAAAEKRLDLGGFFLLAFVTGVGGGTLRDLILDRNGVFWADQPAYIVICLLAAVATFLWGARVERLHASLVWGDAVGLAVFAVIGSGIALQENASPLTAILLGILTATGGGILRDVIRNDIPLILHREVYVSAALAGAAGLVTLDHIGAPAPVSVATGAALAFTIRATGIYFDLHLPVYKPHTPLTHNRT